MKKKHRFNFTKFFLALFIVYIALFGIYKIAMLPIRNIRVIGTTYLNDQRILRESKIDNSPSFLLTTSFSIKHNLAIDPYIKQVTVKKKWFGKLYLYVDEYKILFYNLSGQLVLENKRTIDSDKSLDAPKLVNTVPDKEYNKLIIQMLKVNHEIMLKISEIEYKPNDVDKERFLLTMNDGNYVYLTLYTFSKINDYNKILPTLENKKGILYLDSGNYFEIIN